MNLKKFFDFVKSSLVFTLDGCVLRTRVFLGTKPTFVKRRNYLVAKNKHQAIKTSFNRSRKCHGRGK